MWSLILGSPFRGIKMSKKIQRIDFNRDLDIAGSVKLREGTVLDMDLKSDTWYQTVSNRLKKNKPALYSLYYVYFMILVAIFYPLILPLRPTNTGPLYGTTWGSGSVTYPNLRHPFGTAAVGKDILSQLIAGTETSMIVGFGSVIIFLSIGIPIGLISGYYGGKREELLMRFTDFFIALPFLIFAILAINIVKNSDSAFITGIPVVMIILIALGIFGWAGTARLVNATTKQVNNLEYIAAARVLGASDRRILWKHILPNILAPIIVVATIGVGGGILSEAGLTFLGFGDANKDVSWGTVIQNGTTYVSLHPQIALSAGFMVFFVTMAINLFGDAIRDALDPRLKR